MTRNEDYDDDRSLGARRKYRSQVVKSTVRNFEEIQLTMVHSVLNQGFLYTNFDFFYKTLQTFSLVLTSLDMMFEQ